MILGIRLARFPKDRQRHASQIPRFRTGSIRVFGTLWVSMIFSDVTGTPTLIAARWFCWRPSAIWLVSRTTLGLNDAACMLRQSSKNARVVQHYAIAVDLKFCGKCG